MNNQELHQFILKILSVTKGDEERTKSVLSELLQILEQQRIDESAQKMVREIRDSLPEAYSLPDSFSQMDVIAARRRADRRRWEEENASRGRC